MCRGKFTSNISLRSNTVVLQRHAIRAETHCRISVCTFLLALKNLCALSNGFCWVPRASQFLVISQRKISLRWNVCAPRKACSCIMYLTIRCNQIAKVQMCDNSKVCSRIFVFRISRQLMLTTNEAWKMLLRVVSACYFAKCGSIF